MYIYNLYQLYFNDEMILDEDLSYEKLNETEGIGEENLEDDEPTSQTVAAEGR